LDAIRELRDDGFEGEPVILRSLDMRYAGQNYEREVSLPDGSFTAATADEMVRRFARAHDEFYGFSLEGEPVEFVNLRVVAIGPSDLAAAATTAAAEGRPNPLASRPVAFRGAGFVPTPIYRRESLPAGFTLDGPAVIEEPDSTTVVHPGDTLLVRTDGLMEIAIGR
jgi:N-methylhydantoinase A